MVLKNTSSRLVALSLIFTLLSACKLMDDGVDPGFAGEFDAARQSAPFIWGEPSDAVMVGTSYAFQPEASDQDGDVLEFKVASKPDWVSFDTNTGLLQGIPERRHVGESEDIIISVTDGNSVVSLAPFRVTVHDSSTPPVDDTPPPVGGSGGASNSPPEIAGDPNTSAVAGSQYIFRPDATDSDDDALSFSIINKPAWANFNTTTGRLGGYPEASDIGTSESIEISVTDGTSVVALAQFTITVEAVGVASLTLAWNPPTKNADGSPLVDLAGYRIYAGTASGEYNQEIRVDSAGITSYVLDNLAPGRYFLVMTSVNRRGKESEYSQEIEVDAGS